MKPSLILLAFATVPFAIAALATAPTDGTHKIEIGTEDFKVKIKGQDFEVIRTVKPFKKNAQPEQRDMMRQAVKVATGCEPSDDYVDMWFHLRGKLKCES